MQKFYNFLGWFFFFFLNLNTPPDDRPHIHTVMFKAWSRGRGRWPLHIYALCSYYSKVRCAHWQTRSWSAAEPQWINEWTIEPVRRTKRNWIWIWNWNETNRKATTVEKRKRKIHFKTKKKNNNNKKIVFYFMCLFRMHNVLPPVPPLVVTHRPCRSNRISALFSLCSAQLCSVCLWNWSVSETLTVRKPIRNASKPKEQTGLYENQAHLILYNIYIYTYIFTIYFIHH